MKNSAGSHARESAFIGVMCAAGILAFVAAFFLEQVEEPVALGAVVLLAALSEGLSVRLYFDGRVSVSFVGTLLAAMLFGPPGGVLAAACVAMTGYMVASRNTRKLAFNFGHEVLAAFLAAAFLSAVGVTGAQHAIDRPFWAFFGGVSGAAILFTVDAWSVSAIIALTSGRSLKASYRENFGWLLPHYLVLGVVGGGLAVVYGQLGIAAILVLALPLLLSRYSIAQFVDRTRENVMRLERSNEQLQNAFVEIRDMSDELKVAYTGTLESLVTALDVRDQETRGHSVRVAQHSLDIAKMLGIKTEEELLTVYRGALMHDVGKIGIQDAILHKPGRLNSDEYANMKRHVSYGLDIIGNSQWLADAAVAHAGDDDHEGGCAIRLSIESHALPSPVASRIAGVRRRPHKAGKRHQPR